MADFNTSRAWCCSSSTGAGAAITFPEETPSKVGTTAVESNKPVNKAAKASLNNEIVYAFPCIGHKIMG